MFLLNAVSSEGAPCGVVPCGVLGLALSLWKSRAELSPRSSSRRSVWIWRSGSIPRVGADSSVARLWGFEEWLEMTPGEASMVKDGQVSSLQPPLCYSRRTMVCVPQPKPVCGSTLAFTCGTLPRRKCRFALAGLWGFRSTRFSYRV